MKRACLLFVMYKGYMVVSDMIHAQKYGKRIKYIRIFNDFYRYIAIRALQKS